MKNYHNIETTKINPTYRTGYGGGKVWRIYGGTGAWRVDCKSFRTLHEVSEYLESLNNRAGDN